ncbi:MAG: biopolymer transporter ExbD [Planctomycetota bacterium]
MSRRAFQRQSVLDRAPGSGAPNMTPMVDVTLVILIFFMASATIAGPEWFLRAQLPDAPQHNTLGLPSPVVRVQVYRNNGATRVRGLGPDQSLQDAIESVRAMDNATAAGLVVEIDATDDTAYASVAALQAALAARNAETRFRFDGPS